jgi:hypothetical protein
MGSSSLEESKILGVISIAAAEKLLLDWVNLQLTSNLEVELKDWVRLHPVVFKEFDFSAVTAPELWELTHVVRANLRRAWEAADARGRDWYLFQARNYFFAKKVSIERSSGTKEYLRASGITAIGYEELANIRPLPEVTPFEAACVHLQRTVVDKAKRCGNADCPAPYFIAAKRWQKYCTEKCAGPANREAKRQWWHDNKGKKS